MIKTRSKHLNIPCAHSIPKRSPDEYRGREWDSHKKDHSDWHHDGADRRDNETDWRNIDWRDQHESSRGDQRQNRHRDTRSRERHRDYNNDRSNGSDGKYHDSSDKSRGHVVDNGPRSSTTAVVPYSRKRTRDNNMDESSRNNDWNNSARDYDRTNDWNSSREHASSSDDRHRGHDDRHLHDDRHRGSNNSNRQDHHSSHGDRHHDSGKKNYDSSHHEHEPFDTRDPFDPDNFEREKKRGRFSYLDRNNKEGRTTGRRDDDDAPHRARSSRDVDHRNSGSYEDITRGERYPSKYDSHHGGREGDTKDHRGTRRDDNDDQERSSRKRGPRESESYLKRVSNSSHDGEEDYHNDGRKRDQRRDRDHRDLNTSAVNHESSQKATRVYNNNSTGGSSGVKEERRGERERLTRDGDNIKEERRENRADNKKLVKPKISPSEAGHYSPRRQR